MKINLLEIALLSALASCMTSAIAFARETPALQAQQPTTMQSTRPVVEITLVNKRYQRPPLVRLLVNVVLRNRASEARWFILPSHLNLPPGKGVDGVEVYHLKGRGKVVLGRFLGTDGFQALLLPANAEVTLRDLPMAYWGDLPKEAVVLEVAIAKQLIVGNEPMPIWFGGNPISDAQAEVSMAQQDKLSSRFTSDRREVPVSIVAAQRIKVKVSLTGK
jgi:hypothetical protein